jgi:hypothetical protein
MLTNLLQIYALEMFFSRIKYCEICTLRVNIGARCEEDSRHLGGGDEEVLF